jgi:hypothetical protein
LDDKNRFARFLLCFDSLTEEGIMNKFTKIMSAASLMLGLAGVANAVPLLQILDAPGGAGRLPPVNTPCTLNAPGYNECEVTGDAGGSIYPWANPNVPGGTGAGIPSDVAGSGGGGIGWPIGPGFATDGSFNNALGTSGWHNSFLNLTQSANVTFQYMGAGDSANHNQFEVYVGGAWIQLFDNNLTAPCAVAPNGATAPTACVKGSTATHFFQGGLLPFRYLASIGTANADTFVNFDPDTGLSDNPDPNDNRGGYFLGVDPYLAGGPFENIGSVVYAGLTDLPSPGDHDYQDLGVRISVPEPGSIFLLGAGLMGLGFSQRKRDGAQGSGLAA